MFSTLPHPPIRRPQASGHLWSLVRDRRVWSWGQGTYYLSHSSLHPDLSGPSLHSYITHSASCQHFSVWSGAVATRYSATRYSATRYSTSQIHSNFDSYSETSISRGKALRRDQSISINFILTVYLTGFEVYFTS